MIHIIVAMADNGAIGRDNALIWRISADLKRFKTLTTHHAIVMGRKTHESIGRALPNRLNIVVSRQDNFEAAGCVVVGSIAAAVAAAQAAGHSHIYIIGGADIYRQCLDMCHTIHLTTVHTTPANADAFFAMPNLNHWHKTFEAHHQADLPLNEFDYTFTDWQRK